MVQPIPPGAHTVTPYLSIRGASDAIAFYAKAFGAVEKMRMAGPDGKIMYANLQIGDSELFLSEEMPDFYCASPSKYHGTTVTIHLYVENVDAFVQKAVAAGAKVTMPPMNMFWGDRFAKLQDPFGHDWSIATHVEDVPPAEMPARMAEAMKAFGKDCS